MREEKSVHVDNRTDNRDRQITEGSDAQRTEEKKNSVGECGLANHCDAVVYAFFSSFLSSFFSSFLSPGAGVMPLLNISLIFSSG